MILYADELGNTALSITDHECISSHVKFLLKVEELKAKGKINEDFKAILGNEIYLVDETEMEVGVGNYERVQFYHFLLQAKDNIGHRQLRELSTLAWKRLFNYKGIERVPTFYTDVEDVIGADKGHLVASNACLGGRFANLVLKLLQEEDEDTQESIKDDIDDFINWNSDVFGDDFYIELQPSLQQEQIDYNIKALEIAKAYGLKWIITTDSHYLREEDRPIHKAFLTSEDDENNNREVDSFYGTTRFFSVEDLRINMSYLDTEDFESGILATKEIADKIVGYNFKHKQVIPKIKLPDEKEWYKNKELYNFSSKFEYINTMVNSSEPYDRYLLNLVFRGINSRVEEEDYQETFERVNIECKEIIGASKAKDEPLSSYFVTMEKNIDIIWEEAESIVGAGRGSAGGYIIDYLIGITQINPLTQGVEMPHWRFISAERPDYPDIDIDICSHKKDIAFEKMRQYYNSIGGDIVRVATFGTETAKSAIQTACFKKGTKVKTLKGEKPIELIKEGDWVDTASGWEQVITPTISENKTLINIKTRNSSDSFISCTEDHEILTVTKNHKGRIEGNFSKNKATRYYSELSHLKSTDKNYQKLYGYCREAIPNWTCAKDISKNDFGLKRVDLRVHNLENVTWRNGAIKNYDCGISTEIKIDEDFCELIGIWLAEGSSNRNRISFTIHQKEVEFKNRIVELMWNVFQLDNYYIQPRKDTQALNITYSSRQLFNFFSQLFEVEKIPSVNQWNKYIPNNLKFIEPSLQLQIFKGWFVGDGYARVRKAVEAKATTVSKQLCEDMIFVLNRNFINPYIIKEKNAHKNNVYNVMLYGNKGRKLYDLKYASDLRSRLGFNLEDYTEMDIPLFWNGQVYLKTKIEKMYNSKDNLKKQKVYCLKVPSESFTVNGTIVHNCRGLKINNDVALYLSSMIPVERGKVWSIYDCFYGDEEKGRKPVTEFRNMVSEYTDKNLLKVTLGIEGLINKRSTHACGTILVNSGITEFNSVMKSPSGELITAYELHDSEYCGNIKYDFLNTKTCAMIQLTLEMLVKNKKIEWQGTLRKTYDKYLHPDVINKDTKEMWDILNKGELIAAFQFDSPVGEKAIKLIQPQTLLQATDATNLMRLMGEEGKEQPLDMYVRYKTDINEWYKDMKEFNLTDKEVSIIEKHLLKNYGVCSTQEDMMMLSMDKEVAGFNVVESNVLRKGVAKKIGETFEKAHQLLYEKGEALGTSKNLLDYIWNIQIAMQRGYGFSLLHGIEYTTILIQQLNLVYYYPSIYWNTAVLLIESGAIEQDKVEDSETSKKEKTTNYGEMAKAIGTLQSRNVKISLPYINKADQGFVPNEEDNEIMFGFKGIMKINNETARIIMDSRPYASLQDFHERLVMIKREVALKTGKTQMKSLVTESQTIMLIKAGAFDKVEDKAREEILEDYIRLLNPPKTKLNTKDISKISEMGILPIELKDEMRFYNFREYLMTLKKEKDKDTKTISWYKIHDENNEDNTEYSNNFFLEYFANDMQENRDYRYEDEGHICVALGTSRKGSFDSVYKEKISQLTKWINTNKCVELYTDIVFENIKRENMQGNRSRWEMESMNFYSKESGHELSHVNREKYGVVNFNELSDNPEVIGFTMYKKLQYPKFKLDRIIGTVLDRDKNKHTITLLTPEGVVTVKFYSGQFSFYDKTISQDNGVNEKGDMKKTVLESGWFSRGTRVLVTGFRRGDQFKPKRYKNSIYRHTVQKILEIKENGDLVLQNDRVELVD